MVATLLYRERFMYADGSMREMVIWRLPQKGTDRRYGLKYRLYYGLADGTCLVRYDNEVGKGDHRHYGDQEQSYRFVDVTILVRDFLADIAKLRGGTE
jgi:hypothetical protein